MTHRSVTERARVRLADRVQVALAVLDRAVRDSNAQIDKALGHFKAAKRALDRHDRKRRPR